jgi:hypothetical protein
MIAGATVWLIVARLEERQFANGYTQEAGKIASIVAARRGKTHALRRRPLDMLSDESRFQFCFIPLSSIGVFMSKVPKRTKASALPPEI